MYIDGNKVAEFARWSVQRVCTHTNPKICTYWRAFIWLIPYCIVGGILWALWFWFETANGEPSIIFCPLCRAERNLVARTARLDRGKGRWHTRKLWCLGGTCCFGVQSKDKRPDKGRRGCTVCVCWALLCCIWCLSVKDEEVEDAIMPLIRANKELEESKQAFQEKMEAKKEVWKIQRGERKEIFQNGIETAKNIIAPLSRSSSLAPPPPMYAAPSIIQQPALPAPVAGPDIPMLLKILQDGDNSRAQNQQFFMFLAQQYHQANQEANPSHEQQIQQLVASIQQNQQWRDMFTAENPAEDAVKEFIDHANRTTVASQPYAQGMMQSMQQQPLGMQYLPVAQPAPAAGMTVIVEAPEPSQQDITVAQIPPQLAPYYIPDRQHFTVPAASIGGNYDPSLINPEFAQSVLQHHRDALQEIPQDFSYAEKLDIETLTRIIVAKISEKLDNDKACQEYLRNANGVDSRTVAESWVQGAPQFLNDIPPSQPATTDQWFEVEDEDGNAFEQHVSQYQLTRYGLPTNIPGRLRVKSNWITTQHQDDVVGFVPAEHLWEATQQQAGWSGTAAGQTAVPTTVADQEQSSKAPKLPLQPPEYRPAPALLPKPEQYQPEVPPEVPAKPPEFYMDGFSQDAPLDTATLDVYDTDPQSGNSQSRSPLSQRMQRQNNPVNPFVPNMRGQNDQRRNPSVLGMPEFYQVMQRPLMQQDNGAFGVQRAGQNQSNTSPQYSHPEQYTGFDRVSQARQYTNSSGFQQAPEDHVEYPDHPQGYTNDDAPFQSPPTRRKPYSSQHEVRNTRYPAQRPRLDIDTEVAARPYRVQGPGNHTQSNGSHRDLPRAFAGQFDGQDSSSRYDRNIGTDEGFDDSGEELYAVRSGEPSPAYSENPVNGDITQEISPIGEDVMGKPEKAEPDIAAGQPAGNSKKLPQPAPNPHIDISRELLPPLDYRKDRRYGLGNLRPSPASQGDPRRNGGNGPMLPSEPSASQPPEMNENPILNPRAAPFAPVPGQGPSPVTSDRWDLESLTSSTKSSKSGRLKRLLGKGL